MVDHCYDDHGWPWPRMVMMTMVDHAFEKWIIVNHGLTMVIMTMVDHAFEKWTIVNHGCPWSSRPCFWENQMDHCHGWPWLTMTMLWEMDHCQPWLTMVIMTIMDHWPWLTMLLRNGPLSTMVDHGHHDHGWPCFWEMDHCQPWLSMVIMTMVDHAFEKWTIVNHGHDDHGWPWSNPWFLTVVHFSKHGQPWLNHGQTSWLNHGWPWLTMVQPWVFRWGIILLIAGSSQAFSFENTCCATNYSTSQDTQVCILYLIVYDFTRFRCAENRTPQDHFRCVMVCYRTPKPQKTRPEFFSSP